MHDRLDGKNDAAGSHPRPQQRRASWQSLDGPWEFALEARPAWADLSQVRWDRQIRVPFAPETPASGIAETGFHEVCWYRRTVEPPPLEAGERLLLRFNAVDYEAQVWVDGSSVVRHRGGYTPFMADITRHAVSGHPLMISVRAQDNPHDLSQPRGKQDWQLEPHSIWYPRTSGIWQTVWLERVPATWIVNVRWTFNLERWEIGLEARLGGIARDDLFLRVTFEHEQQGVIAQDTYQAVANEVARKIGLSDPGIDDYRNELLWSPHSPTLLQARLELMTRRGEVLDTLYSYTALRTIAAQGHTVVLNGRPYPLRMVLDQGYWPETGLTAPDTLALRRDVELAKEMGFNGVRKHQKIEDARYLYWADRLGLLVWVEMPSPYRFTDESVQRLTREWMEVIQRDASHPCVIAWVPFNESWGVPNLPDIAAQRDFVEAMYHLTKTLDPTRPVIGNDGWESGATDLIGIHDYDDQPERIAQRYRLEGDLPHQFHRVRPSGRVLMLEGYPSQGKPLMLSEFGGIACAKPTDSFWGYSVAASPQELERRYCQLLEVVRTMPALAGFCYTQFSDTYQEANGLLYADRTPKFPLERMADATRGPRMPRQAQAETARSSGGESPDRPGSVGIELTPEMRGGGGAE